MSLNVAKANLADALKKLRMRMDRVRESWDDEAARRFSREVIDPLDAKVIAAAQGLDHVADLTAAVKRDCGDDNSSD
jgi:hypothetical protein